MNEAAAFVICDKKKKKKKKKGKIKNEITVIQRERGGEWRKNKWSQNESENDSEKFSEKYATTNCPLVAC